MGLASVQCEAVGEVVVRPMSGEGLCAFLQSMADANLPLPSFDQGKPVNGDAPGPAFIEILLRNTPILLRWLAATGPVGDVLLTGCCWSGGAALAPAAIATLSGVERMRLLRACIERCVDDGLFTELAGFFGDLFGYLTGQLRQEPGNEAAESPAIFAASAAS